MALRHYSPFRWFGASLSALLLSAAAPAVAGVGDDSDGDGISDGVEVAAGTDPNDADTDDDGLSDGAELGSGTFGAQIAIASVTNSPYFSAVHAADLDGDGDADALYGLNGVDELGWHENDGTPEVGAWPKHVMSNSVNEASSIASTDLDGDGDLDVVSASRFDDTIAWFENDGTPAVGAWTKRTLATDANRASSVFTVDLDGDGDIDVLSASQEDNKIAWYENDGTPANGGWATRLISTTLFYANAVSAADLDGDGDLDVLGSGNSGTHWYENDGTPSVGSWVSRSITYGSGWLSSADLDGDGDVDVFAGLSWFENDGTAAVGTWIQHTLATFLVSPSAVDMDGDGDLDLLSARNSQNRIAWYENNGTPEVVPWLEHALANDFWYGNSAVASDFDGDGIADLLASVGGSESRIVWYAQRNVADPLDPDTDDDGLGDAAEVNVHGTDPSLADTDGDSLSDSIEINTYGTDPLLTDSDADGLSDDYELAHGFDPLDPDEDSDTIIDGLDDFDGDGLGNADEQRLGANPSDVDSDDDGLLDGEEEAATGTGVYGEEIAVSTAFDRPTSIVAADVDGDGDTDVISGSDTYPRPIVWYENDGTPFGAGWVAHPISTQYTGGSSVVAADVDGDGDTDVISSYFNEPLRWHENDGTPAVDTWIAREIGASDGNGPMVAADIDGDGDIDVLSAAPNNDRVSWYQNDGTPLIGAWTRTVISTSGDYPNSVFAADVDGDGDLDALVASRFDDTIAWYENDGTPAGAGWTEYAISTTADFAIAALAADLDGDGDADVISQYDGDAHWHENDGTPASGAWVERLIDTGGGTTPIHAADMDGDTDSDLLTASNYLNSVSWLENDGTPTVGAWPIHVISTTADGAIAVFAADIDGDGDTDALASSVYDRTIAWYPQRNASDPLDPDTDNDGLLDVFEVTNGINARVAGQQTQDPDADGLANLEEQAYGTNPNATDSDADGLSDSAEVYTHGTNPTLADTDGDGLPDGFEVAFGFDPLDPGEQGLDIDGDGLTNLQESVAGTNPTLFDTDNDGLGDGAELNTHGTNPNDTDTDNDALLDGFEVTYAFNPLVPGQGGLDHDFDGLTTLEEQTGGSNPRVADTDGDLFLDGSDNCPVTVNPSQSDVGSFLAEPEDGIGDACQCGDVDDSGIVDFDDVDAYRDSLANPTGLALTPAGVAKCSVIDGAGPCEILDATVIARALEPVPLLPGIAQVCTAAGGGP